MRLLCFKHQHPSVSLVHKQPPKRLAFQLLSPKAAAGKAVAVRALGKRQAAPGTSASVLRCQWVSRPCLTSCFATKPLQQTTMPWGPKGSELGAVPGPSTAVRSRQCRCKAALTTGLGSKVCSSALLFRSPAQSRAEPSVKPGCSGPAPAIFGWLQGWRPHSWSGPQLQCFGILWVRNFSYS